MVTYSPSSSFIAVAAIIPLLCFVIFSAHNSSISAIIIGIRVGIRVVVGLKKLRLRVICYRPSVINVTVTKGGHLRGSGLYRTSRTIG